MATAEEIIDRAREVLERDGWCQGQSHDEDGRHCMLGALGIAAVELSGTQVWNKPENKEAVERVSAVVSHRRVNQVMYYPSYIPTWNDAIGRSYEDVILAMKQAAHG